ncbi:MAG: NAD(P)/FAD-dependent oxidoreductase [Cyclobacteriaceae bacterium]
MSEPILISVAPEIAFQQEKLKDYLIEKKLLSSTDSYQIKKRSIDARNRRVKVNLTISVAIDDDKKTIVYKDVSASKKHVIIVGAGPAGLFAALRCIEIGLKPLVFERGKDVRVRRRDLAAIMKEHRVNPESNYCFGEGGAGTYSDGKLYTRSKKKGDVKKVLETFVHHGAPQDILVDSQPHIGTNKLPQIITAIREQIIASGGEVHFDSKVTDFILEETECKGIVLSDGKKVTGMATILATGHSARDVFQLLQKKGIEINAKPYALGVRIEHSQELINKVQYHGYSTDYLPAANYKLVAQVESGKGKKGVFSFCMCPGGFIVPAATEGGEIVVNGMSPSRRNSKYANSGIVVEINEKDWEAFDGSGQLAGMYFQQAIEKKASELVGGTQQAPAQRLIDFLEDKKSTSLPDTSYQPGLVSVELKKIFPEQVTVALKNGIRAFGKKMKEYLTNDAVLVGVESRSSSPVSIPRDKDSLEHISIKKLYPCGEGAGYAGGIVSAAIDGERCIDAIYCAKMK